MNIRYYFIFEENTKKGPYTIEEIKEKRLTEDTLVWHKELTDWKQAKEVDEIKPFLVVLPPKLSFEVDEKSKKQIISRRIKALREVSIFLFFFIGVIFNLLISALAISKSNTFIDDTFPIYTANGDEPDLLFAFKTLLPFSLFISGVTVVIYYFKKRKKIIDIGDGKMSRFI
jgi:hypothetical protein